MGFKNIFFSIKTFFEKNWTVTHFFSVIIKKLFFEYL